jgi:hypothetical protein
VKAADKPCKLTDRAGLYLRVTPASSKLWRMRYEFGGREKLLSFGPYPDVSLAEARNRQDAAKRQLREGRDPSLEKKLERTRTREALANSFERSRVSGMRG